MQAFLCNILHFVFHNFCSYKIADFSLYAKIYFGDKMTYKNIIINPDGSLFNEKSSTTTALRKLFKQKELKFSDYQELFTTLWDRYANNSRKERLQVILTALFPQEDISTITDEFYTIYAKIHRLVKDSDTSFAELNQKTKLFIVSSNPKSVISQRLTDAGITFQEEQLLTLNNEASFSALFSDIVGKNNLDKNETLIIGTNLTDDIQNANNCKIDSLWISNSRKVPITPHPNLHVKKFSDTLFYFLN